MVSDLDNNLTHWWTQFSGICINVVLKRIIRSGSLTIVLAPGQWRKRPPLFPGPLALFSESFLHTLPPFSCMVSMPHPFACLEPRVVTVNPASGKGSATVIYTSV